MKTYHYFAGNIPFILSIPHAGTYIPNDIKERLTVEAQQLPDTDWHVEKLYDFAKELDIHILIATHSRYVIDLNRAQNDELLYPGKFTTSLCPLMQFSGLPVYKDNQSPNDNEIKERVKFYWQPYHQQLQTIIKKLHQSNRVILFDAHSIHSQVPKLFDGVLPDLNLGTADGNSANCLLSNDVIDFFKNQPFSFVCNGRFKGGYITRHYGNPNKGVDALQLEIAQKNYMNENYPFDFHAEKALQLKETLQKLFKILISGKYF